ncbi:hypothetical protein SAMN05518672_11220 [Chitinophaga sp. CF118]|nr:hypothetical protein SAMN05518672_11220 [Chitinophaga sp. CF118]
MDGTFVRTPKGSSKSKIKTAKSFGRNRENNPEWKGCGKAAGRNRWAVMYVRHLTECRCYI